MYINVISKASFNESVSVSGVNATTFNASKWC